jgi:hypothetical protein
MSAYKRALQILALLIILGPAISLAQTVPTYTVSTIYSAPVAAQLGQLDVDKDGNIFFLDSRAVTLSKLIPDGTTTVIAGGGTSHNLLVAFSLQTDTFPATEAALGIVSNVAVDGKDDLYIQIGKITWKLTPDDQLTRFAGSKALRPQQV